MLRAGSFLPDKTAILMDNYTQMLRSKYFEKVFEEERRWNLAETSIRTNTARVCRGRDNNGRRIYLLDFGKWDPDNFSLCDILNASYMLMEVTAQEEWSQINGVVLIVVGSDFGFKQFRN